MYIYMCGALSVVKVSMIKIRQVRLAAAAGIQHTCLAALYADVRSISGFIHDINRVAVGH